jgi:hypothetical protein
MAVGTIIRYCGECRANTQRVAEYAWPVVDVGYRTVFRCIVCNRLSIYLVASTAKTLPQKDPVTYSGSLDVSIHGLIGYTTSSTPEFPVDVGANAKEEVPERIRALFREASACRALGNSEAAGCMFRKTIDVSTKWLYMHDARLTGKKPADNLRARISGLNGMGIIDDELAGLADIAALDGNDAAHDFDPYTPEEAEVLEELTRDFLDRVFVRPARREAVKQKQIASGLRKAPPE